MNRTINQAAELLRQPPQQFRNRLKALGVLTKDSKLESRYEGSGYLFTRTKHYMNRGLGREVPYHVVMITERGIAYLAERLDIPYKEEAA
ncbi:phage antirepressor KilAC domain-containing protein [Pseudomonas tohonis]|nr:hypothetical protein L682_27195 [Pseudomonas alcaligenes OT 69]MDN4144959.1 phage antirepressor KilAC domain-containing protein [Pseudomonas tohonis]